MFEICYKKNAYIGNLNFRRGRRYRRVCFSRQFRRCTPLGSASRVAVLNGDVKNNVKITTITYVGDLVCVGADALHRPAGLVDKNGWRQFMGRTIHPAVLLGEATGRCGHRPLRETGGKSDEAAPNDYSVIWRCVFIFRPFPPETGPVRFRRSSPVRGRTWDRFSTAFRTEDCYKWQPDLSGARRCP